MLIVWEGPGNGLQWGRVVLAVLLDGVVALTHSFALEAISAGRSAFVALGVEPLISIRGAAAKQEKILVTASRWKRFVSSRNSG